MFIHISRLEKDLLPAKTNMFSANYKAFIPVNVKVYQLLRYIFTDFSLVHHGEHGRVPVSKMLLWRTMAHYL